MNLVLAAATLVALSLAVPASAQQTAPPLDIPKDMVQYYLVLYRPGPKAAERPGPPEDAALRAHLAHLRVMMEQKKFVVAGPSTDGGSVVGIILVSAKSVAEAREWVDRDPRVRSGDLSVEMHAVMLPSLAAVTVRY